MIRFLYFCLKCENELEKLLGKLKSSANFTLILGLLSITWLIIDYFVIETILVENLEKFSLEWILIIASALAFISFHTSAFITIYYSYRVVMKFRSVKKKVSKESTTETEMLIDGEDL